MAKKAERQEVQLMKLVEPKFLSIVGLPANRTGFKVLRSAKSDKSITSTRTRRKKRSDNSLLSIDFPVGLAEDEANELLTAFGMEQDYELRMDDAGNYFLKRKDSDIDEDSTTPIDLGGGYIANVDATAFASRSSSSITGVTLVGLEMDGFDTIEEVRRWLDGNGINYQADGIEMFEGGAIVTRFDVPEDNEIRKVHIGERVTGLVSRTENTDIPDKVYRSVIEQSYGQWGWGHLNFATALADPEFCDRSWDAIYILRDILENIIIYSGLPLDERKTLVQNATSEFNSYIISLMDNLPRMVIEQARADQNAKQETVKMSQKSEDTKATRKDSAKAEDEKGKKEPTKATDEEVTRKEGSDTEKNSGKDKGTEGVDDPKEEFVTRGQIRDIITEVMRDVLVGKEDAERSDEGDEKDPVIEAIDAMRRDFDEKLDSLKDEVDELGGSTVARSDADDASEDEHGVERGDNVSPFVGMFKGQLG